MNERPRFVSVIFGHRGYLLAESPEERAQVAAAATLEPCDVRVMYATDKPFHEEHDNYGMWPKHHLEFSIARGFGAAYYSNRDPEHGETGGWITRNPRPLDDPPYVCRDDHSGAGHSNDAILPADDIRRLVAQFAETGQRPNIVTWQDSPWTSYRG